MKTEDRTMPDHDMFAVYDAGDGRLVIDQPDPKTGELIPTAISGLPIPKRLTGIGFTVRNAEMHRDQQLVILREQIGIIKMHQQRVNEVADKTINQLVGMGAGLLQQLHADGLAATDAKKRPKLAIAGCGSWVTNTRAASLDNVEWSQLDEDAQADIAGEHRDLFQIVTITTIKPDSIAIRKALEAGREIEGFTLNPAEDLVKFKPEKGTGLAPVGTSNPNKDGD